MRVDAESPRKKAPIHLAGGALDGQWPSEAENRLGWPSGFAPRARHNALAQRRRIESPLFYLVNFHSKLMHWAGADWRRLPKASSFLTEIAHRIPIFACNRGSSCRRGYSESQFC